MVSAAGADLTMYENCQRRSVKQGGLFMVLYDPIVMSPGPFRVVGILTKKECYNLKVDRSEEGWKATQALVRMLGGY